MSKSDQIGIAIPVSIEDHALIRLLASIEGVPMKVLLSNYLTKQALSFRIRFPDPPRT